MTPTDRNRVVQLLRCAADIAATKRWESTCSLTAASWLSANSQICNLATAAAEYVAGSKSGGENADEYIRVILEAAYRVEQGLWPARK